MRSMSPTYSFESIENLNISKYFLRGPLCFKAKIWFSHYRLKCYGQTNAFSAAPSFVDIHFELFESTTMDSTLEISLLLGHKFFQLSLKLHGKSLGKSSGSETPELVRFGKDVFRRKRENLNDHLLCLRISIPFSCQSAVQDDLIENHFRKLNGKT